jgi:hypothetical protein
MKNYQELLSLKESSRRRQKRQSRVVKEAVKCLIDNGFTNIDIASLMTADEADVCTVIADGYASLSSLESDKPCRKVKVAEINVDMSRDKILVRKDGHVRAEIPAAIKRSDNYMAIQCLEDGLSYLNYAKIGSRRGQSDPEADYKTGINFVMDALGQLLDEKNI